MPDATTAAIRSAPLRALHHLWQSKRQGRDMPSRGDIDPADISPTLLPHVMLAEILEDGRVRYRLAGTAMREVCGVEVTGWHLDELLPEGPYRRYVADLYRELVANRRPIYSEGAYLSPAGDVERLTRRLMLPLSSDGAAVDMVLAGQLFEQRRSGDLRSVRRTDDYREELRVALGP